MGDRQRVPESVSVLGPARRSLVTDEKLPPPFPLTNFSSEAVGCPLRFLESFVVTQSCLAAVQELTREWVSFCCMCRM